MRRGLKIDQRTLSAIYHAGLRAGLTQRLGVRWEPPVNGIAEIVDVPEVVLVEFSARTTAVEHRYEVKLDRFVEDMGREPTRRERWRLEREAVIDSRPTKPEAVNAEALHHGWIGQVRALGIDPADIVDTAVGRVRARRLDDRLGPEVCGVAIGVLEANQSTWRPAELSREIAAAIPTDIAAEAAEISAFIEHWTDVAVTQLCVDISRPVPAGVGLRRDGRPVTEAVTDRALTTQQFSIRKPGCWRGPNGARLEPSSIRPPRLVVLRSS